ncbi:MAG: metal-dependent transcriptional regulator, partial [Desulfovibrionales bacterium]
FDLDQEKPSVRVKDIAQRLDVKMPTVTSMLKTLNQRGLVHYEKYEYVQLTRDGADVGKEMRRRHEILFTFLTEILEIDAATADQEACSMEHALSPATFGSLTDFMDFVHTCPRAGKDWIERFREFRRHGFQLDKCSEQQDSFTQAYAAKVRSGGEPG